jgi:hypothetical protein
MKRFLKAAAGLAFLASFSIGITSVAAHHSATMFDRTKVMTIKGVVTEFRWVNPHVSVSVNGTIKDGEQPELWVFEMTSPGNLIRAGGWRRDAVKVGDRVEVTFNPLREIEHRGGSLNSLLLVDTGEKFTNNLLDQEKPGLE